LQKTESGKEDIEALKAQVSALENQLKELQEEDSKKAESTALDKDQIEQLNARVQLLDREGAVLKAQLQKAFADVKEMQQQTLDRHSENSALIVFYQVMRSLRCCVCVCVCVYICICIYMREGERVRRGHVMRSLRCLRGCLGARMERR